MFELSFDPLEGFEQETTRVRHSAALRKEYFFIQFIQFKIHNIFCEKRTIKKSISQNLLCNKKYLYIIVGTKADKLGKYDIYNVNRKWVSMFNFALLEPSISNSVSKNKGMGEM